MASAPSGRFVAVLLPATPTLVTESCYYGPMLEGLSERLLASGLVIRPVQAVHTYQQEAFLSRPMRGYAGAVLVGMYRPEAFIEQVVRVMPGPKVVLDHHFEELPIYSVRDDAAGGMRAIVEHLASLGHRSIAYIDKATAAANPWKREGLQAALEERGLDLPKGWIAGCRVIEYDLHTTDVRGSDVYAAMEWFGQLDPRPTAIVCCDDTRALFAVRAAEALGLAVPDDLSVTGYGDEAYIKRTSRFLTSLQMNTRLMGERAAEIVLQPPPIEKRASLLPLELVIRRSTGPVPT